MKLLPVGLRVTGLRVLVVGGGPVALRKVRLLLKYGADIRVVSPNVQPELRRLAVRGKIRWICRKYSSIDSRHRQLKFIFACTEFADVNALVAEDARRAGVWANRADCPDGSSAHIPSVSAMGPLTLAIFSGGAAPGYVKYLRKQIERTLGSRVKNEVVILARMRQKLRNIESSPARRGNILRRWVNDGTLAKLAALPLKSRTSKIRRIFDRIS